MNQPILVCMVWRGGARFERCLKSIQSGLPYFSRAVLSVTSSWDSADMKLAQDFASRHPQVEVVCTGRELPTMQHQSFWIDYLQASGAHPDDWVYWLAYDDEVRTTGIASLIDRQGNWPLQADTCYFGPWAMRHEAADRPYDGPTTSPLESWTSFPASGPTRLPVLEWIEQQAMQPTYMQMSGSVCPFSSFIALRDFRPRKTGPMRIEMAIAAGPATRFVEEFSEPVSIIYGRPNSDRASYGQAARKEDLHLLLQLLKRAARNPSEFHSLLRIGTGQLRSYGRAMMGKGRPAEEWRVRGEVQP